VVNQLSGNSFLPRERYPCGIGAGIDLQDDCLGLTVPSTTVSHADREGVNPVHYGAPPVQQEAGAFLRARHERLFSPIQYEDHQDSSELCALTGLVTR
jgi:hypothetical protein